MDISFLCPMCNNAPETILHALRNCPKAQLLWNSLSPPFQSNLFFFYGLQLVDWLNLNCNNSKTSHSSNISRSIRFPFAVWTLWLHRNCIAFESSNQHKDLKLETMAKASEFLYLGMNGKQTRAKTQKAWSFTVSGAPFSPKTPLVFCQYEGSVCCSSTDDIQLLSQFRAMNVSDLGCRSLLKSILCSRCDQFSAELYQIDSTPRKVPALCNSTVSANSTLSQLAEVDFCSKVWDECKNVSILNYPYALKDRGGMPFNSTSKLTDIWQSKIAFCNEFGGASEAGEKIGNGSYLNMVAHPDGSNRVFLSDQPGKTWLETVPEQGSGALLAIDKSNPFLDLTDKLYSDAEFGMLGIAFHPTFQQNGCFFVSFNCDKAKWPGCSGRCLCISDVSCDPSKLYPEYGAQPCQYSSIIGEFTANGNKRQTPGSQKDIHYGPSIYFSSWWSDSFWT
ncbi:hypothetical protein CMV_021207 [Castanea mollissima]|uniref:Glucose/Sorbosone dehydrogenase domain-containing protein n=1 Tax=Castanea mollissima TaxID=60419 RepID=A0A8J4QYL0_9ROSI|nr:hypothetical protein CMV_021207 [Castanea mollissima]